MARVLKRKKEKAEAATGKDGKKTILIADDSKMVCNFHSYILKNAGYRTVSAIDGADGLQKLLENSIDLVVTDINMPNMDGYEFVRRIRAIPEYDELPIVIISTESEADDKQKGFDAGANVYIIKPTPPEHLVESVHLLL
ncbi:MAG: response regulator [Candidatus Electrothrix communis]|nr:response regulator [Desulfobulbus sp. US4]WLE98445.1 MAG: response regulator [Candidatus Electrothrix communis]